MNPDSSMPAANRMEGELHYWERISRQNLLPRYLSEVEHRALRLACELASNPSTALDFGCGGGRFAQFAAGFGWKPICMDVDPEAIALCQRRLPEGRSVLLEKNSAAIPLPDASLGLIMCIEVKPVMTSWFAAEAQRTLIPGGLMVGVAYNQWSYRGAIQGLRARVNGTENWYAEPYWRWRSGMKERGFDVVYEEGCYWPPFSRMSNSRLLSLAIGLERLLRLNRTVAVSPLVVFVMQKRAAAGI